MTDIAIRAEGLAKEYRVGPRERYRALRDVLTSAARGAVRRLTGSGTSAATTPSGNTVWALNGASFEVRQGEVVGIIGRNGAGKSTLLKILSKITEPTLGRAEIHGRVGSLLEVGTGFHPELTGRENTYLNGAILGMQRREIDRKFDEIVAFAEVEKYVDTPVKYYSSGMYLRLAFAVAAHLEPEILLVDEVLAVGDFEFQKKCLGRMGEISQGGRTVLFVSHNMAAIRSLCRRSLLVHNGKIEFDGDTNECIDRYLSSGVAYDANEVQTEDLPRPESDVVLGTDLRIVSVALDTRSSRAILETGEPLRVTLKFRCLKPVEEALWGFAIQTMDGIRVLDFSSIQSLQPVSIREPGVYSTTGVLEVNPLAPGTYRIEVGARCAAKGLDWLKETLVFNLQDVNTYASLWMEYNSGLVRLPSVWTPPERAD